MENVRKDHILSCPYCGKRYFPGEIFMPKNFLGTATFIGDDLYIGSDMELSETYTCDNCNSVFRVTADVSFTCEKTDIGNFDENF